MQLSNTPGKLLLPFAAAGGKNTIPVDSQIGIVAGKASLSDGFPPLTRTPLSAGGVPPSGLDMNGILYEMSAIVRWANAGGGYAYDATFATDTNVGGYPKGARIMRADGAGYWYNTTDNNVTDPESSGAAAAGWVPDFTTGVAAIVMASSSVTLTPLQYGKPLIVITGALTANLNLIFPSIVGKWAVINNTTGGFTITGKTATGTGAALAGSCEIVGDGSDIHSTLGFVPEGPGGIATAVPAAIRAIGLNVNQYGVLSLEQGATNPTVTAAKLESFRAYAESIKARVFVPAGTYVLPPATDLAADNTDWYFDAGAVLKLYDTQATTSFITFSNPVNQNVYGMRVDANRAVQNEAMFGQDNCAVLVVNPDGCNFESPEIISSPAKGFALVSTPAAYSRDTTITNIKSADCKEQAVLVDGNNTAGFFERIVIDGVRIGATSHAGVALNDGACNISLRNVISDVQNSVHDAVSVRDSYDIQMSNIRGKRGRNGVCFERLNGYCGRIQMDNVVGENSTQNGVLFLGADDVTAGVVVGRNNGAAGINIAAAGAYRSGSINIAAPAACDDQAVKTQQWGILVQGAEDCRIGKYLAYGNTTRNLSVIRANTVDIDVDVRQKASVTTGEIAAGADAVVTLNWPTAFEDAQIDIDSVYVSVNTSSLALIVQHVVAVTQTVVQVLVRNSNGVTPHTGTLTVIGSRTI